MPADARTPLTEDDVYHLDPENPGDAPVFGGTDVPVMTLAEWLDGGYTLEEFLENFPDVAHEQAVSLIGDAAEHVLDPDETRSHLS